jgi:hypothetical protein
MGGQAVGADGLTNITIDRLCGELENIYHSTHGANWVANSGWIDAAITDTSVDDFYGLSFNHGNHAGILLDLSGNRLAGSFGVMPELSLTSGSTVVLNLQNNQLTGGFPVIPQTVRISHLYAPRRSVVRPSPHTRILHRYLNNSGLCGPVYATNNSAPYNTYELTPDDGLLPSCPPSSETPWWMVWWVLLLLVLAVCILLGTLAFLIWYGVHKRKKTQTRRAGAA